MPRASVFVKPGDQEKNICPARPRRVSALETGIIPLFSFTAFLLPLQTQYLVSRMERCEVEGGTVNKSICQKMYIVFNTIYVVPVRSVCSYN